MYVAIDPLAVLMKVGNLKNVYHFQLAVDVTTNLTTGGYKAIRQLGGSLAEMEHTPHLTAQMKGEEMVEFKIKIV